MRTETLKLVRFGSAKALTREGPSGLAPEPDQIQRYSVA